MALVEYGFKEESFVTTSIERVIKWSRKSAIWPLTFGISCCAIEMMAAGASRFDFDRFGIIFRATPRQSDLMIVAGTVTHKMAPVVKKVYDQMPEPRYVLAMGGCTVSGGPFNTYSVLQGIDKIIPVDVHVPGCSPRPESLMYGIILLQEKIDREKPEVGKLLGRFLTSWRKRNATLPVVSS